MISCNKKQFLIAVLSTSIVSVSQAALTINGELSQPKARIGWGDSLDNARAIMYNTESSSDSMQSYNSNNYSNNNYPNSNYNSTNYNYNSNHYSSNSNSSSYNNSANTNNNSYPTTSYPASSTYNNSYHTYHNNMSNYDKLAISTGSRGVMVVDLVTGEPIYEKNANIARPIASITKLMTAMVVLDAGLDMQQEIQIEAADFKGNGHTKTSSTRLRAGDRMNRSELLLMMLMKSENPAAKTLARHYPGGYSAFMRAMNRKAQDIGMYSAFFGDPTGLDIRNVASPADLVKMIKVAGNYEVIRRYSTTANHDFFVANYSRGNRTYKARNTSYLIRDKRYPIGISKTGFINEAGKCIVMETRINNRPAIVVLLGANSYANRNKDAEAILAGLSSRYVVL